MSDLVPLEPLPSLVADAWGSLSAFVDKNELSLCDDWVKLSNDENNKLFTSYIGSPATDEVEQGIEAILRSTMIDLVALKKLAWRGIPERLRGVCWKLMMGYLPLNTREHTATLKQRRAAYRQFLEEPSREVEEQQIKLDVPRTVPQCPLSLMFRTSEIRGSLERILVAYVRTHSEVGYIQGMNDLAAMFLWVFLMSEGVTEGKLPAPGLLSQVEADAYWCFCVLIDNAKDLFCDFGQGLSKLVKQVDRLLQLQDEELYTVLQNAGCDGMLYGVRWMVCLLTRDLSGTAAARLWDGYIACGEGFLRVHACVCASLLGCEEWQDKMKSMDSESLMTWLFHLPTSEWGRGNVDKVLVRAYRLSCLDTALSLLPHMIPVITLVLLILVFIVLILCITLIALLCLHNIMKNGI